MSYKLQRVFIVFVKGIRDLNKVTREIFFSQCYAAQHYDN